MKIDVDQRHVPVRMREGECVIISQININDPTSVFTMTLVIEISRAECKAAVVSATPASLSFVKL